MWELVKAGGWLMLPIIMCSVVAAAIIAERLWTLRAAKISPPYLLGQVWKWVQAKQLDSKKIKEIRSNSPLGQILAAGLANARYGREQMKEAIQETGAKVVSELERFLTALGTIASIAPLLGLLGTVLGMIEIFSAYTSSGMANGGQLASGIGQALITTAAGLFVAIPAVFFHRYLVRRVDELVVHMEQEAIKLVDVMQGDRDVEIEDK